MSLIQIEASPDVLHELYDIEGLKIVRRSVKRHSDTSWTVGGYATDPAIEAVRARGANVEVLATTEELMQARIERRDAIAQAERSHRSDGDDNADDNADVNDDGPGGEG